MKLIGAWEKNPLHRFVSPPYWAKKTTTNKTTNTGITRSLHSHIFGELCELFGVGKVDALNGSGVDLLARHVVHVYVIRIQGISGGIVNFLLDLIAACVAQWARTNKNRDVSTGPLARPFARSLAPLYGLLTPLRSLVRSLAHSAHYLACGKVNF